MNTITVYEGNSMTVECAVLNPDGTDAVLTTFTATLTIKENKGDTAALISSTGTISGNDITFSIDDAVNTLDKGVYYYEVTIENTTDKYTVQQDRLIIKESIKYVS
jgi:uncharacterized protein YbcV (DUF1398 family)